MDFLSLYFYGTVDTSIFFVIIASLLKLMVKNSIVDVFTSRGHLHFLLEKFTLRRGRESAVN
jgi:hypothetical protein